MIVKKTKQLGNFKKGINLYVPKKRIVSTLISGIVVATTNSFTWNGSTWNKQSGVQANEHGSIRFARSDYIDIPFDDIGTITNNFIFYFNRPFSQPPAFQDKWVVAQQISEFYNDDNYGYYSQINYDLNSSYFPTVLTYNPVGVSATTLPASFNSLPITAA
jgi:hypothetical protein